MCTAIRKYSAMINMYPKTHVNALLQKISKVCTITTVRSMTKDTLASAGIPENNKSNNETESIPLRQLRKSDSPKQVKGDIVKLVKECDVEDSNNKEEFEGIKPYPITQNSSEMNIMRVICEKTAEEIATLVTKDFSGFIPFVCEINPGNGVLTEKLLQHGVPKVYAYEENFKFHKELSLLQKKYPDRLIVRCFNILNIPKVLYVDKKNKRNSLKKIMADISSSDWEDESYIKLVGAVPDVRFLRHIIFSTIFREGLMLHGRPSFYLIIPSSMFNILQYHTAAKKGIGTAILFEIFFNYNILGQFDMQSFSPIIRGIKRRYTTAVKENDTLYLLKIEPKPNLYTKYLTQSEVIEFWYFVRNIIPGKKRRIIPELEKIAPGCGIELIKKNYNIFTTFSELTPQQLFELFKEVQSWPEYKKSIVIPDLEAVLVQLNRCI